MATVPIIRVDTAALGQAVDKEIENLRPTLESIGRDVIAALQGYPGGRTADGKRPAHPGGWGDRTGRLSGSMSHSVSREKNGWIVHLVAGDNKANLLELHIVNKRTKKPYWVLKGIEDSDILAKATREAVARHAPDWRQR